MGASAEVTASKQALRPGLSGARCGQTIVAPSTEEPNDDQPMLATTVSSLRQRLIDDMNMRRFSRETQRNYIRDVGRFATFLGRPPDTATAENLRRFQVEQRDAGVPVPTMNSIVSALRFEAVARGRAKLP